MLQWMNHKSIEKDCFLRNSKVASFFALSCHEEQTHEEESQFPEKKSLLRKTRISFFSALEKIFCFVRISS